MVLVQVEERARLCNGQDACLMVMSRSNLSTCERIPMVCVSDGDGYWFGWWIEWLKCASKMTCFSGKGDAGPRLGLSRPLRMSWPISILPCCEWCASSLVEVSMVPFQN